MTTAVFIPGYGERGPGAYRVQAMGDLGGLFTTYTIFSIKLLCVSMRIRFAVI